MTNMKNLDINNPKHKVSIQDALRSGKDGEFWDIICQRIQASIDATEEQILSGEMIDLPSDEYKQVMEVLRRQRADRLDILDIPEDLVKELDDPDFFKREEEEEIYATKEDFEK